MNLPAIPEIPSSDNGSDNLASPTLPTAADPSPPSSMVPSNVAINEELYSSEISGALAEPPENNMELTIDLFGPNRAAIVTHSSPITDNDTNLVSKEATAAINHSWADLADEDESQQPKKKNSKMPNRQTAPKTRRGHVSKPSQ